MQAIAASDIDNTKMGATHDDSVVSVENASVYSSSGVDGALQAGEFSFSQMKGIIDGDRDDFANHNYTYVDGDPTDGITLSNIELNGQGKVIIDAKNSARIFKIADGASVTLIGITFINANANGNGGSIFSAGSSIIIEDCTFDSNYAQVNGGAIYLEHDELTKIENCVFTNNIANGNGGALDWSAGSIHGLVNNCNFTNNTAERSGGAIYWKGTDGNVTNSIFTNNTAKGNKLAPDSYGSETWGGNGGAIMWVGSDGYVYNCNFTNNSAYGHDMSNYIEGGKGGAVYLQGSTAGSCNNTKFDACTFDSNYAQVNGGAIDWYHNAHNGLVNNSIFTNNIANRSGGAIFWTGKSGDIINSVFTDNTAKGNVAANDSYGAITYGGNGGAVMWVGSEGYVYNTTFIRNSAYGHEVTDSTYGTIVEGGKGGAVYLQGNYEENCTNTKFDNCTFDSNYAHVNGGAIDWYHGASNGLVNDSIFINNIADRSGGAVFWSGHEGNITHSTFTNNTAKGKTNATDSYGTITSGGNGGAVMWVGYDGDVYDCTFKDNTAVKHGGGVYLQASAAGSCNNTTFDNCTFINNTAGWNGGAIDWHEGAEYGLVNKVIFTNNTAGSNGGAIFWEGHNGNITYSNFTGNRALGIIEDAKHDQGDGGAVIWAGDNGFVDNCIFENNTATARGGAVYLHTCSLHDSNNNTAFHNSNFINNTAGTNGGAIDWHEGASHGLVNGSIFIDNTAHRNGGAIFWNGVNGTISNTTFRNNRATGENKEDNDFVFNMDNDIELNTTGIDPSSSTEGLNASKLYVVNQTRIINGDKIAHFESWIIKDGKWKKLDEIDINVSESIISPIDWAIDQFFGGDGGTILWSGDNGTVFNCTFIDSNSARRGGGAYMTGSDNITFDNCTFINCTSGTNGGGVDWLAGANYGKIYNCVFNHTQAARSAGAIYYDGWYGDMQNITIINTISHGGDASFRTIKGDLITYAGWDSSHWDTNTTGGDAGAIMFTGSNIDVYNVTFTNCIGNGRGGAVFLQANHNVTFTLCTFDNNTAKGCSTNTWDDDKHPTPETLNTWLTGYGGAVAFDVGATDSNFTTCNFTNNFAERLGGAISFGTGSSFGSVINCIFENNTARRSGGAISFDGVNCTVYDSTFTNNSALGIDINRDVFDLTDQSTQIKNTTDVDGCTNTSCIYVVIGINAEGNRDNYTMYVYNKTTLMWMPIEFTTETGPSAIDWVVDEYFGGDGGTIFWRGDNGTVDNCTFINSNSARRGGGAYMTGCDNITFSNCNFINCTSGTNGGGLDWLAGANNGAIINCNFTNTRAARSAGAIYYDGDSGRMVNIRVINATSHGGLDLFTSADGRVNYVTWDSSHWDMNTTGGDAGAIMITGNDAYIYNLTAVNCTSVGRGGAVFLQDNHNVTFELCTFENNRALGTALNTWETNITHNSSEKTLEKYTGHGGAIAFDSNAMLCNITDSTFINNTARRNGGAINFDQHSNNNTIRNCTFEDNTVWDDGGAINIDHNSDYCKIMDSTFTNNTATGRNGSTSKGGTICLTGNYTVISNSTFTLCAVYANTSEGAKLNETDAGAIFITGNYVNVTDCNFTDCTAPNMAGAMKLIGNYTNIIRCIIENCTALDSAGAIHISGNGANINETSFVNCTTPGEHGGALCISGNDTVVFNSTFDSCSAHYIYYNASRNDTDLAKAGAMHITGNNATIIKSTFTNNYVTGDGAAIYVDGKSCKLYNSTFKNNNAGDDGGAIYWKGDLGYIYNITCYNNTGLSEGNSSSNGGTICLEGKNITVTKSNFSYSSAQIAGGAIFVTGNFTNITDSTFDHCAVSHDYDTLINKTYVNGGGALYVIGDYSNVLNCNFTYSNGREGGVIYIQGHDITVDNVKTDYTYAKNGGSIYVKGDNATISNSNITRGNATLAHGGAILVAGNNTNISNSNFSYCNAAKYGGAIFVEGLNATIEKSKFLACNANNVTNVGSGGAIFIQGNESNVIDSTFTASNARNGGAIYINGTNATVLNSNFTGNKATLAHGGAIFVEGSDANISGSRFTGNNVANNGGAIFVDGVNTIIEKSTFSGNTATNASNKGKGGSIYIQGNNADILDNYINQSTAYFGGCIYVDGENTVIDNLTTNLTSAKTSGGAIYIGTGSGNSGKNTTIKNSNIQSSRAEGGNGGAIYISGDSAEVSNTNITLASATQNGGAIYISGQNAVIKDSRLDKNAANISSTGRGGSIYIAGNNAKISGSEFSSNNAKQYGGSIYIDGKNTEIDGVTVQSVSSQDGGAVYIGSGSGDSGYNTTIKNSNFTDCTATTSAGAVYINGNNAKIFNSIFNMTSAKAGNKYVTSNKGGAIYIYGNYANISDSRFDYTTAYDGGAVYSQGSHSTVQGSNFTNNVARESGGAIYWYGLSSSSVASNNSVLGCLFLNNTAYVDVGNEKVNTGGGAIYWATDSTYATVKDSIFINNSVRSGATKVDGGAIVLDQCWHVLINNSIFDGNFINGTTDESGSSTGWVQGGAVFLRAKSNYTISNCVFKNCWSSKEAGALYISNRQSTDGKYSLKVYNTTFINNTIKPYGVNHMYGGGAVQLKEANSILFDNVTFENNSANYGGAMRIFNPDTMILSLNNCYFTGNNATVDGGSIYIDATSNKNVNFDFNNFTITNSHADNNGGGLYSKNLFTYTNFTFINNSAIQGGGLYWDIANVEIKDMTFINNTATEGGAIYIAKDSAKVLNSNFTDNGADYGGAIYVYSNSVEVGYNNFTNNSAVYGGAIYERGNTDKQVNNKIDIHDSSFNENHADYGGAICAGFSGSSSTINICNFTNNVAMDGGAIYIAGSNQKVYNCTFEGNNATRNGGAIYVNQSLSGVEIKDSTFKYSHADNGGAIYNSGYTSVRVTIENDTFIKNTAVYNGGAVLYIKGEKLYRDYDRFDKQGVIVDGRTSVTDGSTTFIKSSLFEDNADYNFIINAFPDPEIRSLMITLAQPKEFDPTTGKKFRWVVNITNSSGFFRQVIVDESNYISHYHVDQYNKYLFVIFDEGLVSGQTYDIGALFETTDTFDDVSYIIKKNTTNGTVEGALLGQFAILQSQIQNNISAQQDREYYVIELNRPTYRFTYDVEGGVYDTGCMNITNIDRPLVIIGNGCILNARGFARIFNITASNVTFINVTFTGGNASAEEYGDGVDYGGALYWAGEYGVLEHCIIDNNTAEYGGGVYFAPSASNCRIINTTFTENYAYARGGAIDCNATKMNLTGTVFDANHAHIGAALCREANATGGFGYNNTFINNVAVYAGAALAWINSSSITIDKYYFYNNTAGYSGGALYVGEGSGNCNVRNCQFDYNYVDKNQDGIFDNNDEGTHGGAIEWYAEEGLILNSTFNHNSAYDGGAVYVGEGSDKINITNSTFTENIAVTTGGAIGIVSSNVYINASNFYYNNATSGAALYVGGEGTTNYVYSSTFEGNKAYGGDGGAIEWVASSGHIDGSIFIGNCADNGGALYFGGSSSNSSVSHCNFTDNHAIYLGGAIDANASGMNLTNSVFDSNTAQYGSALCRETNATGGFGYNNIFINNHAYIAGAALGWMQSVNITITNYTFINNTADVSGGAIYVGPDSHNCSIISSTFENNYVTNKTADNPEGFDWITWDGYTAYYIISQTNKPNLVNKTIMNTTARTTTFYYWFEDSPYDVLGVGGAIDCSAANATIRNSNFTNNTAKFGGAINVGSDSGNTKFFDSIFRNNTAYEDGGAINLFASDVDVQDSYFYDNVAIDGGALYVGGSGMDNHVHRSYFEGNNATDRGGAIFWIAYAGFIEDSNFTHNFADNGGAIYLNLNSGNTNITGSRFSYNNATNHGGAIDCNSTNMGLYYTTFEYNEADYGAALCREVDARYGHGHDDTFIGNHARVSGAALAWLGVESVKIYNYTFINNTAENSGGAIYVGLGSNNCLIYNSTFEGNHLTNMSEWHFGGAIDCIGDNLTVNISSFTNNGAYDGGAIYVGVGSGGTLVVASNFTSNYAYRDGGAMALKGHLNMKDVRFSNNTAERHGGALFLTGEYASDNTINDTLFDGNIAKGHGGAIECNASSLKISNTNFTYNQADYGAALCREELATLGGGGNNTFIGNHAYTAGAGLAWLGADQITITHYTFINNTAGKYGGAIYVQEDSENCTVRNSSFTGNHVTDFEEGLGGAICWLGPNALINNTNFTNSYTAYGGAVYVGPNSDNLTVINSSFDVSRAFKEGGSFVLLSDNARFISSNFTNSLAMDEGGAIDAHGITNLTIYDCLFDHDVGAGDVSLEGEIYGNGGALYLEDVTLINISNTKFIHIESHGDGGAIYALNSSDSMLYNLTFDYEISVQYGGSIAWINSTNLTIESSSFNDTEGYFGGGTIYLLNMNDTIIKDTKFSQSASPYGYGGALYLVGDGIDVFNCTFTQATAKMGGAIYVGGNVTIHNITSDSSTATVAAAVIYVDYDNVIIVNVTANNSGATGDGGVAYINANNVTICNFTVNKTDASGRGGAFYIGGSANMDNIAVYDAKSAVAGGSIYINHDNVNITNFKSDDSLVTGDGGVVYIDANNVSISNFTSHISDSSRNGGVFYVKGNVTLNNLTLDGYEAKSGNAIYFEAGNYTSTVANSTFTGPNAIVVNKNVTVYLVKNNITGVGANKNDTWYLNEDISTPAVSKVDYSVWCDGILYLDKNTFDYVIFNNGTIKTPTAIYMLGNETNTTKLNSSYVFWAHVIDDNNNTIISVNSMNSTNNLTHDFFPMPYNRIIVPEVYYQGIFFLEAFDNSLDNEHNKKYNGTLYVKMPTELIIEVGEEDHEILPIIIRITTPIDSNFTIGDGQNVHVTFKNIGTGDEDIFDVPIVCADGAWCIATANFTKDHLHTGSYTITAIYDGDGNHFGSEDNTVAVINSRPIYIIAQVQDGDIFYGQPIYINITTNATNTENGRIYIKIDGKTFSIGLKLNDTGKGINETAEYFEWGYLVKDGVHDGLYIVPNKNFTDILAPGTHILQVKFDNGTYYATTTYETTFVIKSLTTDIIVQYENITCGQSELINVTVNENATGYISLRIGTQVYTSPINDGIARFNITGLAAGTYSDINVTYTPLQNNGFAGNFTNFTFKVDHINDYAIEIRVDSMQYGENATVRVVLPNADGEVAIYIDNVHRGNATFVNGEAVLENIDGLAGGSHLVNVTYDASSSSIYGPGKNSTTFTVKPTDWDFSIDASYGVYGEDSTIYIRTAPYNLTNRYVTIIIDNIPYNVALDEFGNGTLTLNNLSAGSHTGSVNYNGDLNYSAKTKNFRPSIDKATPTITITHDGADVIATVSGNVTGNVTFNINGNTYENVTVDGNSTIKDVLVIGNNYITAIYYEDANHTIGIGMATINIALITTNLTVNATPESVIVGNNITVNVTMVNVTTGRVLIEIGNYNYTVNIVDGMARLNVTLPVGDYTVKAYYLGDLEHTPCNATGNDFTVVARDTPVITIELGPGPYYAGEHISIVTRVDGEIADTNITINGTVYDSSYVIPVNGTFVVNASVVANDTCEAAWNFTVFSTSKHVPVVTIEIITSGPYYAGMDVEFRTLIDGVVSTAVNVTVNGTKVDGRSYRLPVNGTYTFEASTEANSTHERGWNVSVISTSKLVPVITITVVPGKDVYEVGDSVTITANVVGDDSAVVNITVNGAPYTGAFVVDHNGTYNVAAFTVENATHAAGYNNTTFTVVKRASDIINVVVPTGDIPLGENVTVNVTMANIESGKLLIEIGDHNYTVDIVNYEAKLNVALPAGTYKATAYYLGDDMHNATHLANTTEFSVVKENAVISSIIVPTTSIDAGLNATIKVIMQNVKSGKVLIEVNNHNYTVDIVNYEAELNVTLPVGKYNATAYYLEDEKYYGDSLTNDTEIVVVGKLDSVIIITVQGDIHYVGEYVTITATSYDGAQITLSVNGVAISGNKYLVPSVGTYTVTASTPDTADYGPGWNVTQFNAVKKVPTININVEGGVHYVDSDVVIHVSTDSDSAYVVRVGNDVVTGGKYHVNSEGTYTVVVTTSETGKYYAGSNSATFTVVKSAAVIDHVDIPTSEVSGNVTVNVTMGNVASGKVLIEVGGHNYTVDIVDYVGRLNVALPAGEYPVNVYYLGDAVHSGTSMAAGSVKVAGKVQPVITITVSEGPHYVGDVVTITASAYPGADITILVDGKVLTGNTYTLDHEGSYSIVASTTETDKYYAGWNSTTINANKHASVVTVEVNSPVIVGDNVVINVTGPSDIDGNVSVLVGGQEYLVRISGGKGSLTVSFPAEGTYDINVTYLENDKYDSSSNSTTVVVNKVASSIDVKFDNITVGDNAIFNITLPDDATGTITIRVGDYEDTVRIVGGLNRIIVPDLGVGEYVVNVTYNGDDRYDPITSENALLNVSGSSDLTFNVEDLNNGTIIVTLPDSSAGGIVEIDVGGETFSAPVENGVAVVTLDGITPGKYDAAVTYSDGQGSKVEMNTSISIMKYDSPIDVSVINITVGSSEIIVVSLPDNATGSVTVEVDGITQTKEVVGGSVTFNITGLMEGAKTAIITYAGDSNFTENYTAAKFTVSKVDSFITVEVNTPVVVGDKVSVKVTGPSDVEGNATVLVDGKEYMVHLTDGEGLVEIPYLTNGTYSVDVTYLENDKYTSTSNSTTLVVNKVDSFIDVKFDNITVGENAIFRITLPDDATGTVTLRIGGYIYTVHIVGGLNNIIIPNLGIGQYTVNVKYNGDDKYEPIVSDDDILVVNSSSSEIFNIDDLNNGTVVVTVPGATDGKVEILVDNQTFTVPVEDGVAVVNLDGIAPGKYDAVIAYIDDYGSRVEMNTSIDIMKYDSPIDVSVIDITVGDSEIIVVSLPDNATGSVTVEVDGITQTREVVGGSVTFNITGLMEGVKTAIITYAGDSNFTENYTTARFTVSKVDPLMTVNATVVDEFVIFTAKLPSDATGQVLFDVDGVGYYANVTNGVATISVPNLSGATEATVTYTGDYKYNASSSKVDIDVGKKDSYIYVSARDIQVGQIEDIVLTLPVDATGTVKVIVNGETYTANITNGVAYISIAGLDKGTYTIEAIYGGDAKYKASDNSSVSFKVGISIITEVIVRGYNSSYDYNATFLDEDGNPLVDTTVQFIAAGETFNVTTDANGVAYLPGGILGVGNHTIISVNPVTDYETTGTAVIVARLQENKDVVMDFCDGGDYRVRVYGDDGKPVGAGEVVTMKIIGSWGTITYNVKTDADGYAIRTIGLSPGTYSISAEYKGCKVVNTLTVKSTLSAKSVTVKKSAKTTTYSATLKWSNGKAISGKIIKFRFNGKTYSAKTNSKGVASIKITSSMVKNLKVGKSYNMKVTYETTGSYKSSESVTTKIKIAE